MWLAYTRVSRVGDRAERLISPELQAERIEAYAGSRKLHVEALPPELDVSGGRVERPILSEAIGRIKRGEAEGLIVAQLDRLSRMDIADALGTIRRIEEAGGQVIAVAENFDAGTPEGRLARNMMLALGEMQLDRYKAQFAHAKRNAVERGIWPMPIVPLGYELGPDRKLVPGKDAAKVRRGFEKRATGASWRQVGDVLGKGVSGAQKTVRNRVYLGEVRIKDWVNPTAHEPIVDRALFEAAQLNHPPPARRGNPPALLAGLLRCQSCGCVLTRDTSQAIYRCNPWKAGGECSAPAIITTKVDTYVEEATLAHIKGLSFALVASDQRTQKASAALEAAEAELAAYQEVTRVSEVGAEHFNTGMTNRVAAVEAARRVLGRERAGTPSGASGDLLGLWGELSVEERRHVLRGALEGVWITKGRGDFPGRVRIVAAGFDPTDENGVIGPTLTENVAQGDSGP